jgi:inosine triphosphate pyrophosphatase
MASRPSTLNFITGSAHKLSESRAILGDVVNLQGKNIDSPEIQGTIEDIARDKCSRAALAVGGPVLTEDTALEFVALKGLPGPYMYVLLLQFVIWGLLSFCFIGSYIPLTDPPSKHFLTSLGHAGLNNLLAAYPDKSSCAVCTFAFCAGPGQEPILFQGRTAGKIVSARGPLGFGWDPVFEVEGTGKTYAEMGKGEKVNDSLSLWESGENANVMCYFQNLISHRYKALMKLKAWLVGGDSEGEP